MALLGISVVDGGSLLYTIPWTKRSTFSAIADSYVNYVKKHYLSKNCTVKVVFDSYPSVPTTKDSTHIRRGKSKSTNDKHIHWPKHYPGFIKKPMSIKSPKQTAICRFCNTLSKKGSWYCLCPGW